MSLFKSKSNLQELPKPESLKLNIPQMPRFTPLENLGNRFDDELRESVSRRAMSPVGGKKSLFVKIEKYDEAMANME